MAITASACSALVFARPAHATPTSSRKRSVEAGKKREETRRGGGDISRPPVAKFCAMWTRTLSFISLSLYGRLILGRSPKPVNKALTQGGAGLAGLPDGREAREQFL